ncbi:MAG: dockerin type I domain-containing protein [Planctomycetota bacterium]
MAALILMGGSDASAQLRIVTYNTLDKPTTTFDDSQFRTIFGAIASESVNGIARPVDILTLQEQAVGGSINTTADIADELNSLHGTTAYQPLAIGIGSDRLGMVYNSDTVTVLDNRLVSVGIRPAMRTQFRPVGYTDTSTDFYVYSAHFKAGSSGGDRNQRTLEVSNLRGNADALGPDQNVLFTGDFNFGSSFEQGYQDFFDPGNASAVDPTGVTTWNGSLNPEIMTQSTRTSGLSDGGAGGGLDDRFDFQLVTEEVADGGGFAIMTPSSTGVLESSYRAFGNDGVSFNQAINNTTSGRSQPANVLNALHDFSDHLPVVADYQLPALLGIGFDSTADQVFVGTGVALFATVDNVAPVSDDIGADRLNYSVTTSGNVLASSVFGGDLAVSDEANTHAWVLDTSVAGERTGTLAYTSLSQGVDDRQITKSVGVFDHAAGSFSGTGVQTDLTIDFGTVDLGFSQGRTEEVFSLFNLEATAGFTSALSVGSWDAVSGDTQALGLLSLFPVEGDLMAGDSRLQFATLDTTSSGVFSATYELEVGDALQADGALSETLTLTLLAEVVSSVLLGDYNGNGEVDAADYTVWQDNFGSTINLAADGNGNGEVDAADYTVWQDNFGAGNAMALGLLIPEPGTCVMLFGSFGLLVVRAGRRGNRG